MRKDAIFRDGAEHPSVLRLGMRKVLTKCRDDFDMRLGKLVIEEFGNPASSGVSARQIGWKQQDPPKITMDACTSFHEQLVNCFLNLLLRHGGCLDREPGHVLLLEDVRSETSLKMVSQIKQIGLL